MSIYDNSFGNEPKKTPGKSPGSPVLEKPASPAPESVADENADGADRKRRRSGCGCRSCLLGCFTICVIFVVFCGVSAYLVVKRAPDWAHDAIIAAVNDSDLDAKAKAEVTAQMDRLLREYKAGKVENEQLLRALEELGQSPVLVLVIAYTAMEFYIEPSGLSEDEKADAKIAFQRVVRGVFDDMIDPDELEEAFDYISRKDFNGNRQPKNKVSDEDLRALVKECHRVANEADVPNEVYQVDVVAEVKRIVDRALGIMPEEMEETDRVEISSEENADTSDDMEGSSETVLTGAATLDAASSDAAEATTVGIVED